MIRVADALVSPVRAAVALAIANTRYWPGVAPHVRRELRRWERCAHAIRDPALRVLALAKLRDERFNAEVAATLATLVARSRRRQAITAIVAFQVIYDYLDAVTEQPVTQPLRNARQLYRAFTVSLSAPAPSPDYYLHHPQRDDGGYLELLVATCRAAFRALPAADVVAPVARRAAMRCSEAQARTHAVSGEGLGQLARWAGQEMLWPRLMWWEVAAGGAASVLSVHALIAAAADARTTHAEALQIDVAYLPVCALTTLLDSLVDRADDALSGSHAYLSYYADDAVAGERLRAVAQLAMTEIRTLRHAAHHAMTACGAVAYYVSAPGARTEAGRRVTAPVTRELQPSIAPILALFRLWRLAKDHARRSVPNAPRGQHPQMPPPHALAVAAVTGRSQFVQVPPD